jgi:hypothetical protein
MLQVVGMSLIYRQTCKEALQIKTPRHDLTIVFKKTFLTKRVGNGLKPFPTQKGFLKFYNINETALLISI